MSFFGGVLIEGFHCTVERCPHFRDSFEHIPIYAAAGTTDSVLIRKVSLGVSPQTGSPTTVQHFFLLCCENFHKKRSPPPAWALSRNCHNDTLSCTNHTWVYRECVCHCIAACAQLSWGVLFAFVRASIYSDLVSTHSHWTVQSSHGLELVRKNDNRVSFTHSEQCKSPPIGTASMATQWSA